MDTQWRASRVSGADSLDVGPWRIGAHADASSEQGLLRFMPRDGARDKGARR